MEKLFMENGYISLNKYGEQLCGDRVEVKNNPSGDFTMVLADGLEMCIRDRRTPTRNVSRRSRR